MKKYILPCLLLASATAMAQSNGVPYTMTVSLTDGTVVEYTIDDISEITFSNDAKLAFAPVDDSALVVGYAGATKTFEVDANVLWQVTSDNEAVTVEKVNEKQFAVTFPYNYAIGQAKTTLTLATVADIDVPSKTMTITQGSAVSLRSGSLEGNTLTATAESGNKAMVETATAYKFGEFTWTFGEINISENAYFSVNNWGANSVYLMIQFGDTKHQLSAGGSVTVNGKTIHFGFDNGWGGQWNAGNQFTEGTYPATVNQMKTLRLRIEPTKRTGTNQNETISRKVWINDVLVLDNSANVGNVWCDGSTQPGLQYLFGIEGGTGTMTIDSFKYEPLQ